MLRLGGNFHYSPNLCCFVTGVSVVLICKAFIPVCSRSFTLSRNIVSCSLLQRKIQATQWISTRKTVCRNTNEFRGGWGGTFPCNSHKHPNLNTSTTICKCWYGLDFIRVLTPDPISAFPKVKRNVVKCPCSWNVFELAVFPQHNWKHSPFCQYCQSTTSVHFFVSMRLCCSLSTCWSLGM